MLTRIPYLESLTMDVVINSQIQSPLVRTLARTKGKSQSFTHNISDNVAPCSFSKIQLSAQNQGETAYGRNYKIKIPQYGYLRDVILKYTTEEAPISPEVIKVVQPLYKHNYVALEDIRIAGSYLNVANTAITTAALGTVTAGGRTSSSDLSWFNMQSIVQAEAGSTGYTAATLDITAIPNVRDAICPQFPQLLAPAAVTNYIINANNGYVGDAGSNPMPTSTSGGVALKTGGNSLGTTALAGPYTQVLKLNGTPTMWSALTRFYYGIYQLAQDMTLTNGAYVYNNPVARMVWEQLQNEPVQSQLVQLYSTTNLTAPLTKSNGIITSDVGNITTLTVDNTLKLVKCTLPKTVVGINRGGENFWIPKIPQFRWDANGSIVGVDFIPIHLLHPNDNGDSLSDINLISKLSTVSTAAASNFRQFSNGTGTNRNDDFQTWDWQSESYYYQGQAANMAERVQLSTHNRPIQTIFPQETYARIQTLPPAERSRYLKMMQARVSQSGKCSGDSTGKPGQKVMYFPLFLSSTENPSMNFDTRFVEQLDLDVITNTLDRAFVASDVINQSSDLSSLTTWIDNFRLYVFNFDWSYTVTGAGTITIGPTGTVPTGAGTVVKYTTPASTTIRSELAVLGSLNDKPDSYAIYQRLTPRSYVLSLRAYQPVPANRIKVEALCYFHNFHDATSQAIRDSNFKPGTPASLLTYNTYLETVRPITLAELKSSTTISQLITTNNLTFGTTFMIRRRFTSPLLANKRDHLMQTLPIRDVTLTARG